MISDWMTPVTRVDHRRRTQFLNFIQNFIHLYEIVRSQGVRNKILVTVK